MRANLVVVRCGRASRHDAWTAGGAPRNFDLVLCPYEDVAPGGDVPSLARTIPGQKWTGLARFLEEERIWRDYERVWLPDDDLSTTASDVSRFFDLCRRHDAALAAPALAQGSTWTHLVTLRNTEFTARATTFVELMAPCFRRDVLERLRPTLGESRTGFGWGLDDAWSRLLAYRGIWVMDEVAVLHDRPVGVLRSPADREAAKEEMRRVRDRFDACSLRKTVGGFDRGGVWLEERDPRFAETLREGYRWLFERKPDADRRLRRAQARDPEAWLRGGERRAAAKARPPWWRRLRGAGAVP